MFPRPGAQKDYQRMKRIFFSGNNVELSLVMNSLTMIDKLLTVCEEVLAPYCQDLAGQYFPRTDQANEEYLLEIRYSQ